MLFLFEDLNTSSVLLSVKDLAPCQLSSCRH